MIEPSLLILATYYRIKKKICRKYFIRKIRCYATNARKSKKCRKKKCGHNIDLRYKKKRKKK